MKRFLGTTAVILAMAGAVHADSHMNGFGEVTLQNEDFLASNLIGMRIYNSETQVDENTVYTDGMEKEWDDIGEINDILISRDGDVKAVILGVGGFLGMGERDVAVPMDAIRIVREDDDPDDRFLVVNSSKEMLERIPPFERDHAIDGNAATTNVAATPAAQNDNAAVGARDQLTRPMVEREGYTEAEMDMIANMTAEEIQGSYVYGANDETVGEVDSLVLDDAGKVKEVVINVGGFLGLGEKPVAVTFDQLQILKNVDGDDFRIYIDSTQEKLEALPEYRQQ